MTNTSKEIYFKRYKFTVSYVSEANRWDMASSLGDTTRWAVMDAANGNPVSFHETFEEAQDAWRNAVEIKKPAQKVFVVLDSRYIEMSTTMKIFSHRIDAENYINSNGSDSYHYLIDEAEIID